MPLGIRIFLVYVLFIGLTGYFVLNTVMEEIRPGVRQSTEETLVDTANLMAEILRDDFKAGTCLLYTSPSPRDRTRSRMPSSA